VGLRKLSEYFTLTLEILGDLEDPLILALIRHEGS